LSVKRNIQKLPKWRRAAEVLWLAPLVRESLQGILWFSVDWRSRGKLFFEAFSLKQGSNNCGALGYPLLEAWDG